MKRWIMAIVTLTLLLAAAADAFAEPAWGGNCLACHGQLQPGAISIVGQAGLVDPDESGTGALDRGLRPYFRAFRGQTSVLRAEVSGLAAGDTYAVELRRLRFPGVESGGTLGYTGDCAWAEWGEHANYFTDPFIASTWVAGSTTARFELSVASDADTDFYDLILAVAGRRAEDRVLFYADQHFYVQVLSHLPGDMNCDGALNGLDIDPFVLALTDPAGYDAAYPSCERMLADLNCDGAVDGLDIDPFIVCITAGCTPCP